MKYQCRIPILYIGILWYLNNDHLNLNISYSIQSQKCVFSCSWYSNHALHSCIQNQLFLPLILVCISLYTMFTPCTCVLLSQDLCPDAVQQCWRVSCSPCVSCRHCWPCSCQTASHNSATFNKTETQQTTLNHCSLETLTTASTNITL